MRYIRLICNLEIMLVRICEEEADQLYLHQVKIIEF